MDERDEGHGAATGGTGRDEMGGGHGGSYGAGGGFGASDRFGGDRFQGGGFGGRSGFQSGGPNRVLDDLARLATDVAGVAQGARREVETAMRAQAERFVAGMDLVSREEFEAVRDMAAKARVENEALKARLDAMEASATPEPVVKKVANPDA